jgi:hypothetical protein
LARKKKSSSKKRKRRASAVEAGAPPEVWTDQLNEPEAPPSPPVDDDVIVVDPDDDEPVAIDLDADLDADVSGVDALERLIAQTAGASDAETVIDPDDPPTLDLDEDGHAPREAEPKAAAPSAQVPPAPAHARPMEPGPPTPAFERDPAVDLGPVSSPTVRDRLLAEALAHAEHKEARYRVPYDDRRTANQWKALVIVVLLSLAGAWTVAPPRWARPEPPASLSPPDRLRSTRLALLLQAQQVEAYRVKSRQLPASLEELSSRLPGVRYVRSGTRTYQLIAYASDGSAVVYDSADPLTPFRALAETWVLREARQ